MVDIHIAKKDLWLVSAIFVFIVGVSLVVSYGGSSPVIHGHNAGELEVSSGGAGELITSSHIESSAGGISTFTCPDNRKVLSAWTLRVPSGDTVCHTEISANGKSVEHGYCGSGYNTYIVCGDGQVVSPASTASCRVVKSTSRLSASTSYTHYAECNPGEVAVSSGVRDDDGTELIGASAQWPYTTPGDPMTPSNTGETPIGWAMDTEDRTFEAYAVCCSF
jgi:hypothetical protein